MVQHAFFPVPMEAMPKSESEFFGHGVGAHGDQPLGRDIFKGQEFFIDKD
jgi:hypothetical protein